MKHKILLSRREREKAQHRQDMLDTALDLFSTKGYHNVTMHEIAENAEFAVGTLYKFFRNKEDLYKAMIIEKTEEFHEYIITAIEKSTEEIEKLRNYIRTKNKIFRDYVPMIRLYFSETYGESFNPMAELNILIRQRHEESIRIIADIFASGMQKNLFKRTIDPHTLAITLDAITTTFLFRWIEDPEDNPFPEDTDKILNILFKGLVD